jgi:hypothetical protein
MNENIKLYELLIRAQNENLELEKSELVKKIKYVLLGLKHSTSKKKYLEKEIEKAEISIKKAKDRIEQIRNENFSVLENLDLKKIEETLKQNGYSHLSDVIDEESNDFKE